MRERGPRIYFVVAHDEAEETHSPYLLLALREAQAAEGNRNEDNIAVRGDLASAVPQGFEGSIIADAVGGAAVKLHSIGIYVEPVGMLAIVECVDVERYAVVGCDVFALGYAGANLFRVVFADEADVQIFGVVREIGGRVLGWLCAVGRVHLVEVCDDHLSFAWPAFEVVSEASADE